MSSGGQEITRIAAFHITPLADGNFEDQHGNPFDVTAYSLVKYGETKEAWRYGKALGDELLREVPDAVMADTVALTVPAYVYSPRPALSIGRGALTTINAERVANNIEPARLIRMYTNQMGTTAYAQSSHAERQKASKLWVKEHHIPASLIKGATVLAVDDCIITGETERRLVERLSEHGPAEIIGAYAVMVDPQRAKEFPGIEHVLNSSATPTLDTIQALIHEGRFALNSRVLDHILAEPDTTAIRSFFEKCDFNTLHDMYEAVINSSLEFIERHAEAVALLCRAVAQQ